MGFLRMGEGGLWRLGVLGMEGSGGRGLIVGFMGALRVGCWVEHSRTFSCVWIG